MLKLSTFIDIEEVLVLPGNDLIEIICGVAHLTAYLLSRQVASDWEAGKQFLPLH